MIIYCLAIAFQLAGALVLLVYGVSTKRTDILSSFSDNNFISLDGDTKELNDLSIPLKSKFKQAFLNKSAFICLAIGYLLGVFGNIDETERFSSLLIIEYYGAAEPPVRCGVSHLSGLTEPLH